MCHLRVGDSSDSSMRGDIFREMAVIFEMSKLAALLKKRTKIMAFLTRNLSLFHKVLPVFYT